MHNALAYAIGPGSWAFMVCFGYARGRKPGITVAGFPGLEVTMFSNIVLAIDGSEHSQKAARLAGEMARQNKASLRIVHTYDPIPSYLGQPYFQEAISNRTELADSIMQQALELVGEVSDLHHEILESAPAEAIVQVARVRGADLIVMGSRGLGRLEGLLLGSQSQKVVSHAHCPVLLVR